MSPIIIAPGSGKRARGHDSRDGRFRSESWAKAVICIPKTKHRCIVKPPCSTHDVLTRQRITLPVTSPLPPISNTFRKCIKAPSGRDLPPSKGRFFSFFSPTLYALFLVLTLRVDIADCLSTLSPSCPQLLLQVARSSSLDRIPSASCKVVRRSRAR